MKSSRDKRFDELKIKLASSSIEIDEKNLLPNIILKQDQVLYRPNQTAFVDLVITNNYDFDLNIPFLFVNILSDANSSVSDLNILTINDQPYSSYPIDYLIAFNEPAIGGFMLPKSSVFLRL